MINLGTVRPGSTIYIPFETFGNATPSPITITGLATTDIKVYKNGGATARASDAGFTLLDTDGIDFSGLTGIHGVSIDLSNNTTADFWQAGAKYFVVIGDITVDSLTMRFIPVTFQIGYPGALIDTTIATLASQTSFTLTAGPAEDDALNGCVVAIHDIASAVQVGQAAVLDYTGATKTVTLAAATTFTAAAGDNISIFPRGNIYSVNGTPASAAGTVDANVVQISGDSVAADTLELFAEALDQTTGQLDAGSFAANALATELGETLDRLGYLLARSAGACADGQTAAAAYAITRSGSTFTVTMGGLTSAGVRTAPTLTKT